MQSAMLSPVRLSVTRVEQSQTVEVSIVQFSPQSRPQLLRCKFNTEILTGSPWAGASNKGGCGKQSHTRYDQSYSLGLIESCICVFDWHQGRWPWMTLNCYKFKFSRNVAILAFLARDSIYAIARCMPSPVRLYVRLSVTRVDQSKTVEAIMQPSPQSSSMTLVSWRLT